jgi:hypothetical protein
VVFVDGTKQFLHPPAGRYASFWFKFTGTAILLLLTHPDSHHFYITAASMWFRRARLRLSLRTGRPTFQEIAYNDDGKARPVTRGKAKQFTGFEDAAPTPKFKDAAAYRMRSNLSHSSQIPLTGNDDGFFTFEKAAQGRTKYFTSRYKR